MGHAKNARGARLLGDAIKAKDETGFAKAYADLTNECNSCHQALDHGVVAFFQLRHQKGGQHHG